MIKVIAFDLDGLLIDSELIWFQTISEIHTENGYQWNEEDQRDFSGRSTKKVSEIISTKLIKTTQKDVYFQIIKKMRAKLERSIPLMPGATEILNLFKDYPLALVSSSPLELISFVKQKLKWENQLQIFIFLYATFSISTQEISLFLRIQQMEFLRHVMQKQKL